MKRFWLVCVVIMALFCAGNAWGKLYKWVDENGVPHYSNDPPPEEYIEQVEERHESKNTDPVPVKLEEAATETDQGGSSRISEEWKRQQEETKQRRIAEKQAEDAIYFEAYQQLIDIRDLLKTTGVTFDNYTDLLDDASRKINRLPKSERGDMLREIIAWYNRARECWYKKIYTGGNFKKTMPDLSTKLYMELEIIPDETYASCYQGIWKKMADRIDVYEERYMKK